jgi:hypothetical protein
MSYKIIPSEPETLQGGMNTYDSPKVLTQHTWQLIENAYPGITGKPRNGNNELKSDTTANGYSGNPTFFRPHGIHISAGGKDFIFIWQRTDHASYKDEYALEVWNITDNTRTVLEYGEFNADLVFFGFQKLYNALYCVMDYEIKTNHTSAYRTRNKIIEYVGSAWVVREWGIDIVPNIGQIYSGDAETAKFDIALVSHTTLVFNNKMWVIGGYDGSAFSDKCYSSIDGINWISIGILPIGIQQHSSVVFNDKMWVIGGYTSSDSRKVYSSSDGITWTESGTDALPVATKGHSSIVFNNKMWVIGGMITAGALSRKVYSSSDGITWTESGTDALPVGTFIHSSIVFNGKMWLVGGFVTGLISRKVYSSSDGITWTESGTDALPVGMEQHSSVVFNSKMWSIGGVVTGGTVSRKIYSSLDGTTWTESGTDALPVATSQHSSVVFHNLIWVICGFTTVAVKTIYASSDGATWTQQLGGTLKDYYSSFAITYVKKTNNYQANTIIFEEPIEESIEDINFRQIIKMLCSTTTGTWLIPMPDPANAIAQGATHMRVWRTEGNADSTIAAGLDHKYLCDIALSGTVFSQSNVYHDITSDDSLAGETHVLDATGYEPPPQGRFTAFADGRAWVSGNPTNPGYAFCSIQPANVAYPQKAASKFSTLTHYVTCDPYDGQKDTGMKVLGGDLYFFKERKIFVLDNGNADNVPRRISSTIGCACPESLVEADIPKLGGQCLLFESESGPAILVNGGSVRLLSEFKIAELWPNRTGILKLSTGLPTDWYTRNKVTSAFWQNTWWIFYGDSRDTECALAANKCFGFTFDVDNQNVGAFQHTFPQYVFTGTSYTIYEPQILIPIDNIRAYTFSHKANKDGALRYRITRFLDASKWQDTYIAEGAIAYSMKFRPRYQYVGPLRSSMGQSRLLMLYLSYVDTDAAALNVYVDGSRLTIPCTMTVYKQTGMADDKTFRHAIAVKLHDVPRGSFFDYLLTKTVPTTGAVEFFGGEFMIEDISEAPSEEFMAFCGAMTGSSTFIVQMDTVPEVNAYV